jgi:hypothetical protein
MEVSGVSPTGTGAAGSASGPQSTSTSVLKKLLDFDKVQGEALVRMMDNASGVGRSIDMTA